MNDKQRAPLQGKGAGRVGIFQDLLECSTRELISRSNVAAGEAVIDVGCGDGAVSLILAERVGAAGLVYAIDKSEEKLSQLAERAASCGLHNIRTLHGFAQEVLPELSEVDAVYSRFLLMHAHEPGGLLREMRRVLGEGGRIILEEPVIRATYDHPHSGLWEQAIAAYRAVCALEGIDPDYGLRLIRDLADSSFVLLSAQQVQPVLSPAVAEDYLMAAIQAHEDSYLTSGILRSDEYESLLRSISAYSQGDIDYCAFHGVMQVVGVKERVHGG